MKTYSNCICCGSDLEPQEVFIPCYDDGGGLDSFDVTLLESSYPYCDGCDDHIPEECKNPQWIDNNCLEYVEDDDDLPF